MLFSGTPELHHPAAAVFEQGLLLKNWPSRAERIHISGNPEDEQLCLGGLLRVSFKTPLKPVAVDARVTTLTPAHEIAVISRSKLAHVTVALAFTEQNNQHTVVNYEVEVKLGLLGKPLERFLHESGEQAVNEFVDEFVTNISTACEPQPVYVNI